MNLEQFLARMAELTLFSDAIKETAVEIAQKVDNRERKVLLKELEESFAELERLHDAVLAFEEQCLAKFIEIKQKYLPRICADSERQDRAALENIARQL